MLDSIDGIIQQWLTHTGDAKNSGSFSSKRLESSPLQTRHQRHGIFLEECWSLVHVGNLKKLVLIPVKESFAATAGELNLSDNESQLSKNLKACPFASACSRRCSPHLGLVFPHPLKQSKQPPQTCS